LDDAVENGNPPTLAEELACNATTCGGVKAADIAGAIFHHKDDKKQYFSLPHLFLSDSDFSDRSPRSPTIFR